MMWLTIYFSVYESNLTSSSSTVQLLESYDVLADRAPGIMPARDWPGDRPGFSLMGKLLPALFTNSQLAESCGQGLQKKKSDTRPPLDKNKISACKGIFI